MTGVLAVALGGWSPSGAQAAPLRFCAREFEENFYSAHVFARNTTCPGALAVWHRYLFLVRHNAIPRRAFETPYFHQGPRFRVGLFSCRYEPFGLAGSEFYLRCYRGIRYVIVRRGQDAT